MYAAAAAMAAMSRTGALRAKAVTESVEGLGPASSTSSSAGLGEVGVAVPGFPVGARSPRADAIRSRSTASHLSSAPGRTRTSVTIVIIGSHSVSSPERGVHVSLTLGVDKLHCSGFRAHDHAAGDTPAASPAGSVR